jgi:hypothetical protein
MRKTSFILLIIHCTLLNGQWQPDVRLTNNPFNSYTNTLYNNNRCIAASGDTVHVVWFDNRDGNYEIYYKRSSNSGSSWGVDTRLTNDTAVSQYPSESVIGQFVHIVWEDYRDGNGEIYYKRSSDAGISWSADTRLTNNPGLSVFPSIYGDGLLIHVAWVDSRDANGEIYYKRSTDGGVSWGTDTRLTVNPSPSRFPSVSASGQIVHIIWDDAPTGYSEIYYKRSIDGGLSWGGNIRLSFANIGVTNASITTVSSTINVAWEDFRDGNTEIYYKRSTDEGLSWGPEIRLTLNSFNSRNPSISASGSAIHLVWRDDRDGNYEIYYKRSTDSGQSWETDTRLTNNSAFSGGSFCSASGAVVHVVWYDNRDGNDEIYYKRNPTGNLVGIKNINTEIPSEFYLSQNYPNPFNPATKIRFAIPAKGESEKVKIIIFDVLGRVVTTLINEQLQPGTFEVEWNASNYPSGVYYYRITIEEYTQTKKMILIK